MAFFRLSSPELNSTATTSLRGSLDSTRSADLLPGVFKEEIHQAFKTQVNFNHEYGGGILRVETSSLGTLYEDAWGQTQHQGGLPMHPDMRFEIASITKAMTATIIMLMINTHGLLGSLYDPLSHTSPKVLHALNAPPQWYDVTIKQLLHHRSGLPDYWDSPSFLEAFEAEPNRFWKPVEMLQYAAAMPLGTKGEYAYSDTNYVLLGLLIEDRAGMSLAEVFRSALLEPLGMTDTYFNHYEQAPVTASNLIPQEPIPSPSERRSSSSAAVTAITAQPPSALSSSALHHHNDSTFVSKGPVLSHRYEGNEDLLNAPRQSADWAGGGLVSTASDLSRFIRGLMEGQIFGDDTELVLKQMIMDSVDTGEKGWRYGAGLFIVDLFHATKAEGGVLGQLIGHIGWGNSFCWYEMKGGIAVTGTMNQHERNDPLPVITLALRKVHEVLRGRKERNGKQEQLQLEQQKDKAKRTWKGFFFGWVS